MYAQERSGSELWDVPYLPIDPKDLGRDYEAIIRVNSQSGKGGVAYLLQSEYGLDLPRGLQVEFAQRVQAITDERGGELTAPELYDVFAETYLGVAGPYVLHAYRHEAGPDGDRLTATITTEDGEVELVGSGNGPIASLVLAIGEQLGVTVHVREYHEHATSAGEEATAAAYVEADVDGDLTWGVGVHPSIVTASLRAVLNAVNRALAARRTPAEVFTPAD
jgi:2-isopropylmalate synthase